LYSTLLYSHFWPQPATGNVNTSHPERVRK
jgi:hypothetical protein